MAAAEQSAKDKKDQQVAQRDGTGGAAAKPSTLEEENISGPEDFAE